MRRIGEEEMNLLQSEMFAADILSNYTLYRLRFHNRQAEVIASIYIRYAHSRPDAERMSFFCFLSCIKN